MHIWIQTSTTGSHQYSTLAISWQNGLRIGLCRGFQWANGWLEIWSFGISTFNYPSSRVLTNNINRGGVTLLHIPCNSFASLFVVRFFLGLAEASIVPAFLLSMSMFFTYGEQAVMMPIMWSIGNASPITSGLLSYGVLWINTGSFSPWKWFMGLWYLNANLRPDCSQFLVITGVLTIIFGFFVYWLFPDSPLHADFLTYEERAKAILRIKENHSGIEQKLFKRYQ